MNILQKIKGYITKSSSEVGVLYQSTNLKSSNKSWKAIDFFNAYEQSIYFSKAIDKRAEKVGEIIWQLKKGIKGDVVDDHDFLDLLNNPNPLYAAGSEFWKMWQKYYDLAGVTYLYIDTEIDFLAELTRPTYNYKKTKLWLLEPTNVEVIVEKDTKSILRYKYTDPQTGQVKAIDASQVIRTYNHSLKNQLTESITVVSGSKTIYIDNELSTYQSNVLDNGGSIDGVMSFEGNISKPQLDDIKVSYEKEYADAKKAKRPLFLGGKAKYERTGFSPEELSYVNSKKLTLSDIVILTGVPKILLGAVDDIKYSNAQESVKVFLSETVRPLLKNLLEAISSKEGFVPKGLIIDYENIIKEDAEMVLKRIDNGTTNHYLTINEKREMSGLDLLPDKEGNKILVPFNLVDLNELDNKEDDSEKKSFEKKEETEKKFEHPLRNKSFRKMYGKYKVLKEVKNEEFFKKELNKYFDKQKDRLLGDIKSIKKSSKKYKNLIDESFNQNLEVKIAMEHFLPMLTDFLLASGMDTYNLMGGTFNFSLSANVASWLDKKTDVFAKQINDTTFKKLKSEMAESLANEETRAQLVKRIENTYGNISKSRASTIARTEVGGVMTKGTFEAYTQMDIPIKIWVSVNDSNTRSSHASQDGEERPLNTPFSNGLQFPREAGAPASAVINCRCQI